MFNEIPQGRIQNLLTKFFRMKGGSPAPQLAPEIQPILNILDRDPELPFLRGERLGAASRVSAATAGATQAAVALVNPANSGVMVIVEAVMPIIFYPGQTFDYRVRGIVPAGTPVSGVALDGRDGVGIVAQSTVAGTLATNDFVGAGWSPGTIVTQWWQPTPIAVPWYFAAFPTVILPGQMVSLTMAFPTAAIQAGCSWIFRERVLDNEERI